jgi:hypothetical protein
MVEVDGLPGVEDERPGAVGVGGEAAQVAVQARAQAVQPGVGPGEDDVGGAVRLAGRQAYLARVEELAPAEHSREDAGALRETFDE